MRVVSIVGIIERGDSRSWKLPISSATTIHMWAKESLTIRAECFYSSGAPLVFSSLVVGWSAELAVREQAEACNGLPPVIEKSIPSALGNALAFPLTPDDTRRLRAGRYVFDVCLVRADASRDELVAPSALVLHPSMVPA